MTGVPIQIFLLTTGWVVTMSYQKKKETVRLSHYASTAAKVGERVVEYTMLYTQRND